MSEGFLQFVAERTRMSRLCEDARTALQRILRYKHEDIHMDELLEQIAAGEQPDRDIDFRIAKRSGAVPAFVDKFKDGAAWNQGIGYDVFRYTGSVDAAMTLIPKGWGGSFHIEERGQWAIVKLGRSHPTNAEVTVEARTLPRAICLAALKAGMVTT